jgi:hypothetical protein
MPPDPREPENYSIDEMMERLQERPGAAEESGELVTRADGSQAIRVRKRKRRSRQPAREKVKRERKLRAVQITAVLVTVFLLLLAAGGTLVYCNTSPYRLRIVSKLQEATGAEAEIAQFRVSPGGAAAQSVGLQWPDGGALKSLALRDVAADLSLGSFLGGSWVGEEVTAREAKLRVGMPAPEASGDSLRSGNTFFHFDRVRCDKASVFVGDGPKSGVTVKDSEMSFYPKNPAGRSELRLNRGTVAFGYDLPTFQLDRSLLVFNEGRIDVVGLRLNAPNDSRGVFELAGSIHSVESARPSSLDIKLSSFPIHHLVGPVAGKIVSGPVDTPAETAENFLTFTTGRSGAYRLVAALEGGAAAPLKITGLPCLSVLARLFNDDRFAAPLIDGTSSMTLRMEGGNVRLEDLQLEAKARLMIRGSLEIAADQSLSGVLQLGLAPSLALADDSGRLHRTFGPASDGYRWVEVTVSGTVTKPRDDFRESLERSSSRPAAKSEAADESDPATKFEELTKPR